MKFPNVFGSILDDIAIKMLTFFAEFESEVAKI